MAENKKVEIDLSINTGKSENSLQAIKKELKELKAAALDFGEGTAGFNEATKRAGELQDKLADVNGTIKALSGNTTENLTKSFSSVAQAGVGGFQAIIGAQALFGSKNKEIQETLVKLQGAMAFSQGLKEFANIGQAAKDFKVVILSLIPTLAAKTAVTATDTVAQEANVAVQNQNLLVMLATNVASAVAAIRNGILTATTGTLTVSTTAFGVASVIAWAAATLGVSLLITGLIALVAYFDEIVDFFKYLGDASGKEAAAVEEASKRKVEAENKYREKRLDTQSEIHKQEIKAQFLSGQIDEKTYEQKVLKEDFILNYRKLSLAAGLELQKASSKEEQDQIRATLAESLKGLKLGYDNDIKASNDAAKKKADEANAAIAKSNRENAEKAKKVKEDEAEKLKQLELKYTDETEYEKINRLEKAELEIAKKLGASEETKKNIRESYRKQAQAIFDKQTDAEINAMVATAEAEQKKADEKKAKDNDELDKLEKYQKSVRDIEISGMTDSAAKIATIDDEEKRKKKELQASYDSLTFTERQNRKKEFEDSLTQIEKEAQDKRNENADEEKQKQIDRAVEIAESIIEITRFATETISQFSAQDIQNKETDLNIEQQRLKKQYDNRRAYIEANIKDEKQRAKALADLDKQQSASDKRFEKEKLELEKRKIRAERNATLISLALATATSIANAVKIASTSSFDPISFAINIAANIAAALLAIGKARNALKEADAAGAGGGGDVNTSGGGGGGGGAPGAAATPVDSSPGGLPTFNLSGQQIGGASNMLGNQAGGGQGPVKVFVTETDISSVQGKVNVIQGNSLFGG